MNTDNIEIEAKFLEIDAEAIKQKLREIGAEDLGEDFLHEIIFYDRQMNWPKENKFVRIRHTKNGTILTYKHDQEATLTGTTELEFRIDDADAAKKFLEALGLVAFRKTEKKRHSFKLGEVAADLDAWPGIPTYLELEGPSEQALKEAVGKLGLDWSRAVFGTATRVIEGVYKVPVKSYRYFTFSRVGKE